MFEPDMLAKTGLRVHFVNQREQAPVEIGKTATAICGEVWEPSILDPEQLNELPYCYDCIDFKRAGLILDAQSLTYELNRYDREHPDEAF